MNGKYIYSVAIEHNQQGLCKHSHPQDEEGLLSAAVLGRVFAEPCINNIVMFPTVGRGVMVFNFKSWGISEGSF